MYIICKFFVEILHHNFSNLRFFYIIPLKGSAVYDGLAVDHLRKKLYYSNAGEVGSIGELSTDGSKHRVLMLERGTKPRAVVIDVDNR